MTDLKPENIKLVPDALSVAGAVTVGAVTVAFLARRGERPAKKTLYASL